MGGKFSKKRSVSSGAASYWYDPSYPPASPYPSHPGYGSYPSYMPQHRYAPSPSPYRYADQGPSSKKRLERKFSRIADNYHTLQEVTAALAQAGLESSNLIVGIDFTKSNEWTGTKSFYRRSLHHVGDDLNPYEQAISIIGKTLSGFDEDNSIPCFGFGDASTHDQDVFSFYNDERQCDGFEEVLARYRELVPQLRLAGPTSFAPIIETAMTIVEESGGQYHVLLIIADGQVTRSVDTQPGQLSPQEQKTIDAIVRASAYPLSIVLVGVGDGPWDMMKEFDDNIPVRAFDNFQFVNFTEITAKHASETRKQTEFALAALMEVPSQYKATLELNLLGGRTGQAPGRIPLPPPLYGNNGRSSTKTSRANSFKHTTEPHFSEYGTGLGGTSSSNYNYGSTNPSSTYSTYGSQDCAICLTNAKDMAFGCGHQTCCECGEELETCPICRRAIQTRIRLY